MIEFRPPGKYLNELRLPRAILGSLLAARTGHGDFKAYHEIFHHEKIENCICGATKTPVHFFFCRKTRDKARREIGKRRPQSGIDWLLGSAEGAAAFGRILENISN